MSSDQIKKREYMKNFFMPKSGALSPLYTGLGAETQQALLHSARKQCRDGFIACALFITAAIVAVIVEPNKWAIIACLALTLASLARNAMIALRYRRGWYGGNRDEAEIIIRDSRR